MRTLTPHPTIGPKFHGGAWSCVIARQTREFTATYVVRRIFLQFSPVLFAVVQHSLALNVFIFREVVKIKCKLMAALWSPLRVKVRSLVPCIYIWFNLYCRLSYTKGKPQKKCMNIVIKRYFIDIHAN